MKQLRTATAEYLLDDLRCACGTIVAQAGVDIRTGERVLVIIGRHHGVEHVTALTQSEIAAAWRKLSTPRA